MIVALQAQIAQAEPGVFPFRIAPQKLHVQPFGFFFLALLFQHAGQVVHHIRQIRCDLQSALVVLTRLLQIALFLQNDSQIDLSLLGVGTDAHGLAVGFDCIVIPAALLLGYA